MPLIVLLPFLAAVLAPVVHRVAPRHAGWVLALVPALLCAALLALVPDVAAGQSAVAVLPWIPAYDIAFSLRADGLSLTFAVLISGIGALILLYSGAYLKGHPHLGRFLSFLLLFTGAMLGLVLADNTLVLVAFWELTSVTSFLLIGFDSRRQAARRAAIQAVVVTGIGGLGLLLAIVVLRAGLGSWELSAILLQGDALRAGPYFLLALLPILLAAFTKSAQLPFQFWLPNAMEAPTPVSAFLHSATMVQAGVYLLARVSPLFAPSAVWQTALVLVGGATLLWGSYSALKQTDLKLMLAHTTVAALGTLVLLLGIGSQTAVVAAAVYLVAHALYKAGLFLVVGILDHETGTRDLTLLRGLSEKLPATFIAAAIAAFSMLGLPASVGFFGKEEMYAAAFGGNGLLLFALLVLVLGNIAFGAVGLTVALRPFLGAPVPTPREPHENAADLLAGPVALAIAGIATGLGVAWLAGAAIGPFAAAVLRNATEVHLGFAVDLLSPVFILSLVTWVLAAVAFRYLDVVRIVLRRLTLPGWSFDRGFDALMLGLIALSGRITRTFQHGSLRGYLLTMLVLFAIATLLPLAASNGMAFDGAFEGLRIEEIAVMALGLLGLAAVIVAPSLLIAILALGVQGLAVALIFMLFGAPDLAFTQAMVEVLTVVILALVMTRLRLHHRAARGWEAAALDGIVAVFCGGAVTLLLLAVLAQPLDLRLSEFFAATSLPVAHGRNIVNVILVDFRGLDTLGEISVVMAAGIAIVALLRRRRAEPLEIEAPEAAIAPPPDAIPSGPAPSLGDDVYEPPVPVAVRWHHPDPVRAPAVRWFHPEGAQ